MATEKTAPSLNEHLIALGIALVSITMALVLWRSSVVASDAGTASRWGMIQTIRQEMLKNLVWSNVYHEANIAQIYFIYAAEAQTLSKSSDPLARLQASTIEKSLLPALKQKSPLTSNALYQRADGSVNLERRFKDAQAAMPPAQQLHPQRAFDSASRGSVKQRWLVMDAVLFALALFWLTVAQIASPRRRAVAGVVGGLVYALGLAAFVVIELSSSLG
ncbi:MAG: hypothetical protein HY782_04600 [Chloroflexi bacterium]|nr:hypothetical protein [Chloroflexota bacterium]